MWSRLQAATNTNTNSASARTIALPASVTAASDLILGVSTFNSGITLTIADDLSNAFTQLGSYAVNGNIRGSLWRLNNASAGARTITVTPSASAYMDLFLTEYAGLSSASPTGTSTNTGTSASPTSGSVTVTGTYQLVVAMFALQNQVSQVCPESAAAIVGVSPGTVNSPGAFIEAMVQSSLNAKLTLISSQAWAVCAVALSPASAPGSGGVVVPCHQQGLRLAGMAM